MSKGIAVPKVQGSAMLRLPPCIALVDLDCELSDYLTDWLSLHWPEARVRRVRAGDSFVADLAIVDHEPAGAIPWPTLWLADIEHSQAVRKLGPRLWRTAMPTTALRLKRVMEACLDTLRA